MKSTAHVGYLGRRSTGLSAKRSHDQLQREAALGTILDWKSSKLASPAVVVDICGKRIEVKKYVSISSSRRYALYTTSAEANLPFLYNLYHVYIAVFTGANPQFLVSMTYLDEIEKRGEERRILVRCWLTACSKVKVVHCITPL